MIKRFFERLPFSFKISLIGVIPLAVVVFLTIELYREKQDKLEIVSAFRDQIVEAATINELIDALQTERRYTFGFALNGGWAPEMAIARAAVDQIAAKLDANASSRIYGYRDFTLLNGLNTLRRNVDQKRAGAEEVMNSFTGIILRFNTLAIVTTSGIKYIDPITNEVRGQRTLSQMITYLGILRSDFYYSLYSKEDAARAAEAIKADYAYFRSVETEFLMRTSPESKAEYQKLVSQGSLKETFQNFDYVVRNGKYPAELDAEEWWTISATGIDQLKAMQRNLREEVVSRTNKLVKDEENKRATSVALILAVILLVLFMLIFTIRVITNALVELKEVAVRIAVGEDAEVPRLMSNDVVSDLSDAVSLINDNNRALTVAAGKIGRGNFDVQMRPRSDKDVLVNAVITMKDDLQRYAGENADKIWLQEGLNRISSVVSGEKSVKDLCEAALQEVSEYGMFQVAAFFVMRNSTLYFECGLGISEHSKIPHEIRKGELQLGKAAQSGELMVLTDLPSDYLNVRSATGEDRAVQIAFVPLRFNNQTEGVLELASRHLIDENKKAYLQGTGTTIATALQAALSRQRLQELLEETQAQSEELQTQHSELESLNEELEAQTQNLQASEEELKVQQEELLQANTELEERTQLLQQKNSEIQEKARELAQTTKYKSEFLANMSHELRTPLNSILLLSRLLADNNEGNLSPEQIEFARIIKNSGNGLLELINEILDLSKIETGKMDVEIGEVSVAALVNSMNALFSEVAKEKNIDFVVSVSPEVPEYISSDKMRVEQIVRNLISNAIKFTSEGHVKLNIGIHENTKDKVSFTVEDTGIGIPVDKHKLIFEAFQQADGSTKRKYGGTGLGLSISRELAQLLQGDIKVESEEGKGSRFSLVLPFRYSEDRAAETENAENEIPSLARSHEEEQYISPKIPEQNADDRAHLDKDKQVILIVEDDIVFAKTLSDFTHKRGYQVIHTVRGDEALPLAKQYKPAGILLDLQLPVKSGWAVMDELKQDPATRHIPVHIMSSHSKRKESLVKGAVDFIDKPVVLDKMQSIFEKIEQVLKKDSKKVLIVEENAKHAKALSYFLETYDITSEIRSEINEGITALKSDDVDCVILDMGIPASMAYDILEKFRNEQSLRDLPIIIFTGKNMSLSEEAKIRQYADSIIVKTAHSYQRMLDEVSLFLHVMQQSPSGGRKSTRSMALDDILKGKKVLVTDDDVRNIFSLTRALEGLGLKVYTATNGNEALSLLEKEPGIDIVLLDMMMPEMDGYEAARRIRANPRLRKLPVLAVTAKAMSGDREKCIEAGASDYISKPVDIDQLISLLRVWLYDRAS